MIVFPNSSFFKQMHLGVISENNLEKSSYFMNHIRTAMSERSSMVLTLSGKREQVTLPFLSYTRVVPVNRALS